MQISLNTAERGAAVYKYDLLFSAGLLLSAALAFHLPFTQFICQDDTYRTVTPSAGE